MTLNGHGPQLEDPRIAIARAVYGAGMEDGDTSWPDLTEDERASLAEYAEGYIAAHVAWLSENGFRLLAPGMLLKPTTEAEAMAMVRMAKEFMDRLKRRGQLMGGAVSGPKLIVPPGGKLQ